MARLVARELFGLRIRCAFGLLLECCWTVLADALRGRLDRGVNSSTSRQNRNAVLERRQVLELRRQFRRGVSDSGGELVLRQFGSTGGVIHA